MKTYEEIMSHLDHRIGYLEGRQDELNLDNASDDDLERFEEYQVEYHTLVKLRSWLNE